MIGSSLRDGGDIVDMLLKKEADATMKSKFCLPFRLLSSTHLISPFTTVLCLTSLCYIDYSGQVSLPMH